MSKNKLSASDQKFVMAAAEGEITEVELAELAAEKALATMKKFGQRTADDHGKANDRLKNLASEKGVTVPSDLNAKDGH